MNTRKFCILYVDDDDNDLHLAKFAAESAGLADCLQMADSGPRAIDYFQGHGAYSDRAKFPIPHVVLLDLRMPRMNGLEVLGWLRSRPEYRGVVVIIFTASAHADDIARACELGANAFVQKPSSHTELISFLKVVKEFWKGFHLYPVDPAHLGGLSKPKLTP